MHSTPAHAAAQPCLPLKGLVSSATVAPRVGSTYSALVGPQVGVPLSADECAARLVPTSRAADHCLTLLRERQCALLQVGAKLWATAPSGRQAVHYCTIRAVGTVRRVDALPRVQ